MSLAVLIPYRPDTPERVDIQATTAALWRWQGVEPIYADDGLTGLFSYARAANRARAKTDAEYLLIYNTDALPLSMESLERIEKLLASGVPWTAVFTGQQRFTQMQTDRLIDGEDPFHVGPAEGDLAMGREALPAVRADVWDDLGGMDERFVGWGPEDFAFHRALKLIYPDGCDEPAEGLFQSLWHPDAPRTAFPHNTELWRGYQQQTDAAAMRRYLEEARRGGSGDR